MRLLNMIGMIATVFVLTNQSHASVAINDSDLSGFSGQKRELFISNFVMPDSTEKVPSRDGETRIVMVIEKDGVRREIPNVFDVGSKCQKIGDEFRLYAKAQTTRFVIQDRDVYEFGVQGICGHEHTLVYQEKSPAGELAGVWDVVKSAEEKMIESQIINLWSRTVKIIFPADGDYYSGDRVRVTKGYQWDVVGHELGHAIYDQAKLGSFGGGPHRIDECYSEALALSEGWASYYAAWLKIDRADSDAKFEYMVPRRAPLRIEHVPADVCQGPRNEWRVTAFLWDLLDLNADNEEVGERFSRLWQATATKRSRNIAEMKQHIVNAGLDADAVEKVWQQNFFDR